MHFSRITSFRQACSAALAACALVCLMTAPASARERQYKVEAAYLYNFFNYITWPGYTSPQALKDPLICVYGNDPIVSYLQYIQRKMAAERTLNVRNVTEGDDASGCHLFFMRHRISARMLTSLSKSTLTVFKPDDPLDRGGMIELSEDEERISMRISQSELEGKGFQTSSRLLELARVR